MSNEVKRNPKCYNCNMCELVTHTVNDHKLDSPYYQCLASMEDICLRGEPLNIREGVVLYRDLTDDQKDKRQELWIEVLNDFCPADRVGNRPCDNGCPCDRCHYDSVLQLKYMHLIKDRGLTLTTSEVNQLERGLGDE